MATGESGETDFLGLFEGELTATAVGILLGYL